MHSPMRWHSKKVWASYGEKHDVWHQWANLLYPYIDVEAVLQTIANPPVKFGYPQLSYFWALALKWKMTALSRFVDNVMKLLIAQRHEVFQWSRYTFTFLGRESEDMRFQGGVWEKMEIWNASMALSSVSEGEILRNSQDYLAQESPIFYYLLTSAAFKNALKKDSQEKISITTAPKLSLQRILY